MTERPLIIYVSGAPGSGKTTLARKIAEELYIPHISSDLIHGGVRQTEGKPNDRQKTLLQVFVPLMVQYAHYGISFVVDHVLQRNLSEASIIDKLRPHANLVYIHTIAANAIERQLERELKRTDRGQVLTPDKLVERNTHHRNNLEVTERPLELNIPTLEVCSDDGYEPDFDHIITFIEHAYRRSEL